MLVVLVSGPYDCQILERFLYVNLNYLLGGPWHILICLPIFILEVFYDVSKKNSELFG